MATSATEAALRYYGGLYANRLLDGLQANEQSASGKLEESVTLVPTDKGFNIEMLPYFYYVDKGRKKGNPPPFSAIYTWLTYPNVMTRLNTGSYEPKLTSDMPYMERAGIADLIVRKIAARGTKGNNFFTNVVESDLVDEMTEGIANAALDDFNNSITF